MVQAILLLEQPQNVKQIHGYYQIIQWLWRKSSEMLPPHTDLVREGWNPKAKISLAKQKRSHDNLHVVHQRAWKLQRCCLGLPSLFPTIWDLHWNLKLRIWSLLNNNCIILRKNTLSWDKPWWSLPVAKVKGNFCITRRVEYINEYCWFTSKMHWCTLSQHATHSQMMYIWNIDNWLIHTSHLKQRILVDQTVSWCHHYQQHARPHAWPSLCIKCTNDTSKFIDSRCTCNTWKCIVW